MLDIVIEMIPVGKARPRMSKFGVYTPQKTVNAENQIAGAVKQIYKDLPVDKTPLRMDIDAYFPYPKSMSKKKRAETIFHINKPDKDNLEKLVLDALNGVVYKDDCCVCAGDTRKFYSENPRIEIRIRRLNESHT